LYHSNREEILHATVAKFTTSPQLCAPYVVNLNNNSFQLKTLLIFVRLHSQQNKTEKVISSYQILTLLF